MHFHNNLCISISPKILKESLVSNCVKNVVGLDKFAQTTLTMFTTFLLPDTFLPPTFCGTVQCSPAQPSKMMYSPVPVNFSLCKVHPMQITAYVKPIPCKVMSM